MSYRAMRKLMSKVSAALAYLTSMDGGNAEGL